MIVAGICSLLSFLTVSADQTRPNVLILVSDDQGWGDVGYHGSEISTPNIDQLGKEGLEMNRWYSNPWCGPTRASMLTGHIAARHGIFSGGGNLTHDEQLMNEAFKDAGYVTMTAGKWHLGRQTQAQADLPINRGFDHTYGSLMAGPDYFTHGRGEQKDWARNGKTVFENGYMTDLFGNEISRLIRERDPSKPFFSYVAFTAPHTPLQAPQEYIDKYAHIENEDRRIYCAMVEVLDIAIGNILQAVDDEGIRDNTLVLFFSDNGGGPGASNGDFRGRKGTVYEGGTRLPAIFRWPGKIPSGVRSEQPMIVYDLFPTLVEALDIPTNLNTPFDGESLWDALQTGETRKRKTDMFIGAPSGYAVLSGEYKLVHSNINRASQGPPEQVELFKIYDDPSETTNVAEQHSDVVNKIVQRNAFAADWIANAPAQTGRGPRARGGLRRFDSDGDGVVLRSEVDESALEQFATADTNKDGKIDSEELAARGPGGRGGRGPGGGGPPAARDANGNIIHMHEAVPAG